MIQPASHLLLATLATFVCGQPAPQTCKTVTQTVYETTTHRHCSPKKSSLGELGQWTTSTSWTSWTGWKSCGTGCTKRERLVSELPWPEIHTATQTTAPTPVTTRPDSSECSDAKPCPKDSRCSQGKCNCLPGFQREGHDAEAIKEAADVIFLRSIDDVSPREIKRAGVCRDIDECMLSETPPCGLNSICKNLPSSFDWH
jgi:hypothetical protein